MVTQNNASYDIKCGIALFIGSAEIFVRNLNAGNF